MPLADGGEGTLDCLALARPSARRVHAAVVAVHGQPIDACWLRLDDQTAVIESAEVLGLPRVQRSGPAVERRGSASLAEMIRVALDAGCRRLFLALGGSATNDCGIGLLQGLGLICVDAQGRRVTPDLAGLLSVDRVDAGVLDSRLAQAQMTVLCDVDNPLCGPAGATAVYGRQKGLAEADARRVDEAFARFAALCDFNPAASSDAPGAGAAGGLGFALSLLGARLDSGATRILDLCGFAGQVHGARLAVTGEGRADGQTLHGKLPAAVARSSEAAGVPVALVAGGVDEQARPALSQRFVALESLTDAAGSAQSAMDEAPRWLEQAGAALAERFLR